MEGRDEGRPAEGQPSQPAGVASAPLTSAPEEDKAEATGAAATASSGIASSSSVPAPAPAGSDAPAPAGIDAPAPGGSDAGAEGGTGMPPESQEEGEDIGQGVRKLTLSPGKEDSGKPLHGATVFAHYRAWIRSTGLKIFDTWEEQQQLEMTIGSERKDLKGLSWGVVHMQRGERALIHVPFALAYGEEGSFSFPSVPPRADLVYEVQLNGFDNPAQGRQRANLTVEERIESAERRRQEGNKHFREDRPQEALLEYEMALGYMGEEFMMQMFGKYRDMANAVRLPCLLNSAACHLKLNNFQEASGLCSMVLAEDKDNVKALFRRGKARMALGQMDAAAEDLKRALALAPDDAAIKKALQEVRKEEKERMEEQKRLFKGMFSSPNPKPPAKRAPWLAVIWKWLQRLWMRLSAFFWRSKRN